jgi:hypothetical protein
MNAKNTAKVYRMGPTGELEGSTDSSSMAAKSMAIGGGDDDIAFNGVVQIDADTRVPFMVMDASRSAKVPVNPAKPFFNLVVVHDLFDTAEKMKIFLRPMVQRYLGMFVCLFVCVYVCMCVCMYVCIKTLCVPIKPSPMSLYHYVTTLCHYVTNTYLTPLLMYTHTLNDTYPYLPRYASPPMELPRPGLHRVARGAASQQRYHT